MKVGRMTQPEKVLALLRSGPKSTLDLRSHYVMAVGYVVYKLRSQGHHIETARLPNGVALYTLSREPKENAPGSAARSALPRGQSKQDTPPFYARPHDMAT